MSINEQEIQVRALKIVLAMVELGLDTAEMEAVLADVTSILKQRKENQEAIRQEAARLKLVKSDR